MNPTTSFQHETCLQQQRLTPTKNQTFEALRNQNLRRCGFKDGVDGSPRLKITMSSWVLSKNTMGG